MRYQQTSSKHVSDNLLDCRAALSEIKLGGLGMNATI